MLQVLASFRVLMHIDVPCTQRVLNPFAVFYSVISLALCGCTLLALAKENQEQT